ncbi:uncharacterized protein BJX67DRAFT_383469 [Aspergillus lucknowensis]|uniref:Uncharacterized protein n=1 Tax=Aspergillus lucknowensis TaxID=176173 RepID=A0ABR4LK18_9EURO
MANSRRFLSWDPKFTKRNAELYNAENMRLHVPPGMTKIEAFLSLRVHRLMPEQYSYAALREFLERDQLDVGRLEETVPILDGSPEAENIVVFDERRDPSRLNTSSSRYWAEYAQYPPPGESICLKALSTKGLYDILKTERAGLGTSSPERRSIYIRDLSPICALALVLPVSIRYAPSLRDFLSKYITARAFFGTSIEEDTFSGPSTARKPADDSDLKVSNAYTWAIQVLQLFSNQLVKTIEAWNEFADKHLHVFHPDETPANFLPKVQGYLESLDTDVSELRFIYRTIVQRIGAFESRRSNILNTSALVEARASNTQADNIGLLTKVTVFYLPLGLMTAVFSMAFIPSTTDWWLYLGVLAAFTIISVTVSFNLAWFLQLPVSLSVLRYIRTLPKHLTTRRAKKASSVV